MNKFFKSFYVTLLILVCLFFIFYSSTEVYEKAEAAHGNYKRAVELTENGIHFFDME